MATERTPFKFNFRRHLWKGNLTIQIELPKLEDFLIGLQRSWEEVMRLMEITKEAMKISIQTDLQRNLTRKNTNPLGFQRILVKECFNWNFQKDGWYTMCSMKTYWHDARNHSSRVSTWNQHYYQILSMRKKSMKLKKSGSIGNEDIEYSF